ncbi:MAG: transketolase family protein [Clostridiales bacterium]|jgi:transketolase|nr:transketolase family protein [Clostridiales bacterium]
MLIKDRLMKDIYVDFLREQLSDPLSKVVALEADLAKCSGVYPLMKEFPSRVINVGIAEQNMASVAAGLSAYGFIPFIHTFGPFASRRMCDQLMISVCYAKQNVKIIGSDPGITAELNGGTHMPFEDIGVLRSIPGIVIYEPTDNAEFKAALPKILKHKGPVYVRMYRKTPPSVYGEDECGGFNLFKAKVLRQGADVTVVASGIMVSTALEAAAILDAEGISAEVVASPTVKPLDAKTIAVSARKTGAVVTAENHSVIGGLKSAVAEALGELCPVVLRSVGVKEKFGEVGKMPYLRKAFNMETADVVAAVKSALQAKTIFAFSNLMK